MLCLGYSRCVFFVAEIGPWNAEDVVQGAFQGTSALGLVQRFMIPVFIPPSFFPLLCLDSAGDNPVRERGHHQVMVGTVRIDHPPRRRNLPPGVHRFKQGGQEAFTFPYPPRFTASNRCAICTHPASPAHYHPSEPLHDSAFTDVEPHRQPPTYAFRAIPDNPDHDHVLEDEPPLGTHRILLSSRANA